MIRVSKEITTGRILCSQGGAFPDDATMIANARSAFPDIPEEEIEVADLTEEEFAAALAAQNAPTLEQARAVKLAAIQAEKNRVRDGGFLVEGTLFDSDAGARVAYLEIENKLFVDNTFTVQWKASDGVWVTMNAELYDKVKVAGTEHIHNCFLWQATKEAAIMSANSIAELDTISVNYPD